MRIIILTPIEHFHAPIVIRALKQTLTQDEIIIVTTPKLPGRGNFLGRLSRLVKQSGWDYLLSMILAKLCFSALRIIERFILGTSFQKRKYLTMTDVIRYLKLRHYHFKNINSRSALAKLASHKPDIVQVVFFNQILKVPLRQIPRLGCVNLHPSYLPFYRGYGPCFWALANLSHRQTGNEMQTGVSLHYITEHVDMGPIIKQAKVSIYPSDSFFSLYRRCAEAGAGLLGNITEVLGEKAEGKIQDETEASHFGPVTPLAVRRFRCHRRRFAWLA